MSSTDRTELGLWLEVTAPVPERDGSDAVLRKRVIALSGERRRRRRLAGAVMAVGATSVLIAVGVARFGSAPQAEAIRFRLDPGMGFGTVGAYVAPVTDIPLDLRFSEGSVIELLPGARARVAATSARGATVLLETGHANVDVVHRPKAEWSIVAGAYSVRVRGTSFTVGFDPATQLFELSMRSGVVTVEGPGISTPIEIRGAQRFVHRVGDEHPKPVPIASVQGEEPAVADGSGGGGGLFGEHASLEDHEPRAMASKVVPRDARQNWASRVSRGEYAAVLREAEAEGVPQVMARVSAEELLALANAARFLGRVEIGREGYTVLRRRFPGTQMASLAAFLMGRLMESGSPGEARQWFERYEREAPAGPLAAEAMGRRMLLLRDRGGRFEAERLAEEYVRRYPDGAYAGVARKIAAP